MKYSLWLKRQKVSRTPVSRILLFVLFLLSYTQIVQAQSNQTVVDINEPLVASQVFYPFFTSRGDFNDSIYRITGDPQNPTLISNDFQVAYSIKPELSDGLYYLVGQKEGDVSDSIYSLDVETGETSLVLFDERINSVSSLTVNRSNLFLIVDYSEQGASELLMYDLVTDNSSFIQTNTEGGGSNIKNMIFLNQNLYFTGTESSSGTQQLWEYDYIAQMLNQLSKPIGSQSPGSEINSEIYLTTVFRGMLFLVGSGPGEQSLYSYDGNNLNYVTRALWSSSSRFENALVANSAIYFLTSSSIVISDGTPSGTVLHIDLHINPTAHKVVGDSLYFIADRGLSNTCKLARVVHTNRLETEILKNSISCAASDELAHNVSGQYILNLMGDSENTGNLLISSPVSGLVREVSDTGGIQKAVLADNTEDFYYLNNGNLKKIDTSEISASQEQAFLTNQIVYAGETSPAPDSAELFHIDNVTGRKVNLTNDLHQDAQPSIRPDGREIVYSSYQNGDWDLYKMDLANKEPINITDTDVTHNEGWPVHAPFGNQVLHKLTYTGVPADNPCGTVTECMMLMDLNSDTSSVLLENSYDHAAWSPSGTQIVASGVGGVGGLSLFDVNAPDIIEPLTGGAYDDYAVFTNDGQYILFASDRCGNGGDQLGLYYYDVLGEQTIEVLCDSSTDFRYLSFMKDGRLVFTKSLSGLSGQRSVHVTSVPLDLTDISASQTLISEAQAVSLQETNNYHPISTPYYSDVTQDPHRPNASSEAVTGNNNAIVLTHGWNSTVQQWIVDTDSYQNGLADQICIELGLNITQALGDSEVYYENKMKLHCSGGDWDIWVKDWRRDSSSNFDINNYVSLNTLFDDIDILRGPIGAYGNAFEQGNFVGSELAEKGYDFIHFYGHSAGSNLIDQAKNYLKGLPATLVPEIHMTFFDAYDPTASLAPRSASTCSAGTPSLDLVGSLDQYSRYGEGADYVDNYTDTRDLLSLLSGFDATKLLMHSAYNVDVTKWDPDSGTLNPIARHSWPFEFYIEETFDPGNVDFPLGFQLSRAGSINYPSDVLMPAMKCELPENPGDDSLPSCVETVPLCDQEFIDSFEFSLDDPLAVVASSYESVTGLINLGTATGILQFTLAEMVTGSPAWFEVEIESPESFNTIEFDAVFKNDVDGFLKIYVDGLPVSSLDQRLVSTNEVKTHRVFLGDTSLNKRLGFRLDSFSVDPAEIEIGNVKLIREDSFSVLDLDLDGMHNNDDLDDDGDGIPDTEDQFPQNVREWADNDNDGLGDNVDNDDDNDEWADGIDNCELLANPDQEDFNDDGIGDACDRDGDGVLNEDDAFPDDSSEQIDSDEDGIGDNADLDDDNDNIEDLVDNCPMIVNEDQLNTDGDLEGDVCDNDQDNDGVLNGADIDQLNPFICEDTDFDTCDDCSIGNDGFGVLADNDPANDGIDINGNGQCNLIDTDDDSDGIEADVDNCPLIANPDQQDSNGNGVGDLCDVPDELCIPIKASNGNVSVVCL